MSLRIAAPLCIVAVIIYSGLVISFSRASRDVCSFEMSHDDVRLGVESFQSGVFLFMGLVLCTRMCLLQDWSGDSFASFLVLLTVIIIAGASSVLKQTISLCGYCKDSLG